MSTTLSLSSLGSKILWDYESVNAWGNSVNAASYSFSTSITNGTGANQCDKIYVAQGTIAGGGTLVLDLTSLTDMFGAALSFARVKVFFFSLTTATSASSVTIGNNATNPALTGTNGFLGGTTPTVSVRNGGNLFVCSLDATSYPVDSTHKSLLITNADGTNTATYQLAIAGCSV